MKRRQTKKNLKKFLDMGKAVSVQEAWDVMTNHFKENGVIGAFVDTNPEIWGKGFCIKFYSMDSNKHIPTIYSSDWCNDWRLQR